MSILYLVMAVITQINNHHLVYVCSGTSDALRDYKYVLEAIAEGRCEVFIEENE